MSQITIHMCQKQERSCLIRLLLCLSNPGSLPAQDPCQPKIPVCPRSQSAQDPSRPKIPVNPRSQSAQDPSQPKVPVSPRSQSAMDALMPIWLLPFWYLAPTYLIFGPCLFDIWLMPIWYLAHNYLIFGSCLFDIWLMRNLHQLNFSSIYYIPTWISVIPIWLVHAHFLSLKNTYGQAISYYATYYSIPCGVAEWDM